MLKVVPDPVEANSTGGGSLLDEIVRDGARQMLAAALQAEVAAYISAHAGELDADGRRLVVRNGYHADREVTTAAGAVAVRQPRVNDKRSDEVTGERKRFSSTILPAWSRKSPRVAEVLPLLYLHGLSSSDFGPALTRGSWGRDGVQADRVSPDQVANGERTPPRGARPCRRHLHQRQTRRTRPRPRSTTRRSTSSLRHTIHRY